MRRKKDRTKGLTLLFLINPVFLIERSIVPKMKILEVFSIILGPNFFEKKKEIKNQSQHYRLQFFAKIARQGNSTRLNF